MSRLEWMLNDTRLAVFLVYMVGMLLRLRLLVAVAVAVAVAVVLAAALALLLVCIVLELQHVRNVRAVLDEKVLADGQALEPRVQHALEPRVHQHSPQCATHSTDRSANQHLIRRVVLQVDAIEQCQPMQTNAATRWHWLAAGLE